MYQFLLFPRFTMLMAFPIRLFDAETIKYVEEKDNGIWAETRQPGITEQIPTNLV
jgi:hypothetical protein